MADFFNTFQRDVDICERAMVFSAPADDVDDFISTPGSVYVIGGVADLTFAITGGWRSKQLDFSDVHPELKNRWKTIDHIQLKYKDLYANTPVTIFISNDGGETWDYRLKLIGEGDNMIKVEDFHFLNSDKSTGRSFIIRLESSSSTTSFEWHGISIWIRPRGEYFKV